MISSRPIGFDRFDRQRGCMRSVRAMGRRFASVLIVASVLFNAPVGARADESMKADEAMKAGWSPEALTKESADCTEQLVQGAWENTKREQGADPALPLTPEIRTQLAPQIAAMRKLCECAVRAGARRYTKAEADASPAGLDRFVADTVATGECKLEP
jgi:hypothetical protein